MDMGSCYANSLAPEIAARYHEKLQLFCDNIDPYSLATEQLSTANADLPNISARSIRSYLLHSKCPYGGLTPAAAALSETSHREADNCNNSNSSSDLLETTKVPATIAGGWQARTYCKCLSGISIVLGDLQHPETGESLSPWFVAFPDGYVLCAHCPCAAGANETCSHIGGLLRQVAMLKQMDASGRRSKRIAAAAEAAAAEAGATAVRVKVEARQQVAQVTATAGGKLGAAGGNQRVQPELKGTPIKKQPPIDSLRTLSPRSALQLKRKAQQQLQQQQPPTRKSAPPLRPPLTSTGSQSTATANSQQRQPVSVRRLNAVAATVATEAATARQSVPSRSVAQPASAAANSRRPIPAAPAQPAAHPAANTQQQQPAQPLAAMQLKLLTATTDQPQSPKPIVLNFSNGLRKINIITAKTIHSSTMGGIPVRTTVSTTDGSAPTAGQASAALRLLSEQRTAGSGQQLQQQQQPAASSAAVKAAGAGSIQPRLIRPHTAATLAQRQLLTGAQLQQQQLPPPHQQQHQQHPSAAASASPAAAAATVAATSAATISRLALMGGGVGGRKQQRASKTRRLNGGYARLKQRAGGGGGGGGGDSGDIDDVPRIKLYVCGICAAQFADKARFMRHCQRYHVLPAGGLAAPLVTGEPATVSPPARQPREPLVTTVWAEPAATATPAPRETVPSKAKLAMRQLARLLQREQQATELWALGAPSIGGVMAVQAPRASQPPPPPPPLAALSANAVGAGGEGGGGGGALAAGTATRTVVKQEPDLQIEPEDVEEQQQQQQQHPDSKADDDDDEDDDDDNEGALIMAEEDFTDGDDDGQQDGEMRVPDTGAAAIATASATLATNGVVAATGDGDGADDSDDDECIVIKQEPDLVIVDDDDDDDDDDDVDDGAVYNRQLNAVFAKS